MLDIKFIKENQKLVRENIKRKNQINKLPLVEEIVKLYEESLQLKQKAEKLRHNRNELSEQINSLIKQKKNPEKLIKELKTVPEEIKKIEERKSIIDKKLLEIQIKIPNIIHPNVPLGKDSTENKTLKTLGKIPKFDFQVKGHVELGEALGLFDFESSARTSGNGFYYLQGDLALLNQALIQFGVETMVKKGFLYVETPLMLRGAIINNVTDLNDQQNQIYKLSQDDLYLIGTSEHSLIGRYVDTLIPESKLPIKHTSYSMCFRKEIGSHGIDEKGVFRTHQFNKIEMIVISHPKDSMKFYQEMQDITVEIFTSLGIPIRVLGICSGDLGDLKHIQVDIEAWSPRKKEYFEVGSCSNLTESQARKLKIRIDGKERYIPHTLNNTAIATSRALVAIMENYQQKDGSIKIPEVLQKYLQGKKVIKKLD